MKLRIISEKYEVYLAIQFPTKLNYTDDSVRRDYPTAKRFKSFDHAACIDSRTFGKKKTSNNKRLRVKD